jgi:cytochrome c peroxidase
MWRFPYLQRLMVPATLTLGTMAVFTETIHAKEAVDLAKVREAIVEVVEADAEKRGDGTSLYGTFVRLAWHCSGSYSKIDGSGGSNGARMRFDPEASWGGNAGLKAVAQPALESVKEKFPDISYADLYTYAGVVAVEECGGPTIKFRLGRVDATSGDTSPPKDDRLPNPDKGSHGATVQHLRDVFYRMGEWHAVWWVHAKRQEKYSL